MTAEALFARWRDRIESQLDAALPSPAEAPQRLHQAMRYSVLGGGKRMRPLLVYASGQLFGAQPESLDAAAMAVELIHAYSLVHDDLPAMDDDALRRGKPTTHIAFDEATAILAGDALQTRAFGLLADAPLPATLRVACLQTLAHASGASGMCGGQALDIDATGQQQTLVALTRMHALKTGALIRAAVRMGALCGQAHEPQLAQLDSFADALGLAFQVRETSLMSKPVPSSWARPPARTRRRTRAPSPPCSAWTVRRRSCANSRPACSPLWPDTARRPTRCVRWRRWRWNAITDRWR